MSAVSFLFYAHKGADCCAVMSRAAVGRPSIYSKISSLRTALRLTQGAVHIRKNNNIQNTPELIEIENPQIESLF